MCVNLATREGFALELVSYFRREGNWEGKGVPKWWFVYWVSWLAACGWTGVAVMGLLMSTTPPS